MPNDAVGRNFALLADPVKRAIIEELLIAGSATPAQLATEMQTRFAIGRAAVSSHITQLEDAFMLARELDRTVRLIDPHGVQIVIVEAHRLASTAAGSAALTAEALRANLEERLQDRPTRGPDISAFFASQATGPTFETDGPIQRPNAVDAPQAQALPTERWRLTIYWVKTNDSRSEDAPLRRSVAAFYYAPPAHIVIVNADWPPLARVVARQITSRPSAEVWEATYPLVEREVADALGAAVRRKGIDARDLNEDLHELLGDRLPSVEQRLRDALQRRPPERS
ncbi:MAG: helix-turn-helix domain-containing protein [Actinomycetota bacterium]|nr:helix-turn-helix domain-containing protein [Actinomycetota bacterium]